MAVERVLLVGDTEANNLFFEVIMNELGISQVKSVVNAAEGIEICKQDRIQFVIAAWESSPIPGTVLVQKVRDSRRTRRMPFLIYSKRLGTEELALIRDVGMTNVLGMPFDRAKATTMISGILDAERNLPKEEIKLRKIEDMLAENRPAECLKFIGPDLTKKGPHLPRFKCLIAEAWIMIGQPQKAAQLLEEAMTLDPEYSQAFYLKSRLLSTQGKHDEAITLLQKIVEKSPLNISSKVNLGAAFVEANRIPEAKKVIAEVSTIDPDSQTAKDELGKIAFIEGDLTLAGQLLAQTEKGDAMARYFNSMAVALVAKSEYTKAIATYENALKVLANQAKLHLLLYNLGLAHKKNNDLKKSFTELSKAYLADPTFEKAYAALVRITKEMSSQNIAPDATIIKKIKEARAAINIQPKHPDRAA